MNWQNILKQPELRTGSKITTTLGRDSKEDEEGPCFKKLKEYQEKIMSKTRILDKNIDIYLKHILEDMPEEVACAALKIINEKKFINAQNLQNLSIKDLMVDGKPYLILSEWSTINNSVFMFLEIESIQEDEQILLFDISITKNVTYVLSPDEIEKYSETVNWRDN